MSKKDDLTKIDPRKELSPYLNHQENKQKNKNRHKVNKLSASLSGLRNERKKSLIQKLSIIIGSSVVILLLLLYYVSPLANVNSVEVQGADDLSPKSVVSNAGIAAKDKVIDYQLDSTSLNNKLIKRYPEIKGVNVKIRHCNQLVLQIAEHPTIAYIKEGNRYRKVLSTDELGSTLLKWSQIDQSKPLFIGYNKQLALASDLKLFDSLPYDFRRKVKLLSGNTNRKSQIIFVMKDGNVVIGDIGTIKEKIKYYEAIRAKAAKNSLIDLEVGAFSRPLTAKEIKAYAIS